MPDRRENQTDKFSRELAELIDRYPDDYVAPALTHHLVRTALRLGLSRDLVTMNIRLGFEFLDKLGDAEDADH